jgi:hypothetical protein
MEEVIEFCNTRPASLNVRYVDGMWQAQLVALDGSFSATAYEETMDEMFGELYGKVFA